MPQVIKIQKTINGTPTWVQIRTPTSFEIGMFNLSEHGRVASGLMVMDYIAQKRKLMFEYDIIKGKDRKAILDLIFQPAVLFFSVQYDDSGTTETRTFYVGEISAKRFRTDGGWYWKNFAFNLIER